MTLKHNWRYFDQNEKLFVMTLNKNHEIFYYYKDQIVDDVDEASVIVKISNEYYPLETSVLRKAEGKVVVNLPSNPEFLTESQKELARTDWMMIRELEKLLPDSSEVRVLRNHLRSKVDNEINNQLSTYKDSNGE